MKTSSSASAQIRRVFISWLAAILCLAAATVRADLFYVTNDTSENVEEFNSSGANLGTYATGFLNATGLEFGANGTLYVANYDVQTAGWVQQFTSSGTGTLFANTNPGAIGVAIDNAGDLFVASRTDSTIQKITPGGVETVFATSSSGLDQPYYLAFDSSGNLYSANVASGTILKYTPTGAVSTFASGLIGPSGIAFDPSGNVYVTNDYGEDILKYGPTGGGPTTFASGFNELEDMTFDQFGNMYACDFGASTIYEIAPNGSKSTFIDTGLDNPEQIAITTDSGQPLLGPGAVPEPGSGLLAILGAATPLASRRFRRRSV